MTTFKPYPELVITTNDEGEIYIGTASGKVRFKVSAYGGDGGVDRLIDCWNACRRIAFPEAHIIASDDYTKRLENLRKEAWSRAEALQAELDQLKASMKVTS